MKASGVIALVVFTLAGLGGGGFLYMQARAIDNTGLERAVSHIQSLQGLDSRWSVELMKVSNDPQAHFDGLAAISPQVTRLSGELKNIARRDSSVTPDLKAALQSYVSRLAGKSERVERFKSAYAIVRNSERYLPIAMQLVVARSGEFKQTVLERSVSTNHTDLKNYFITPSAIEKGRILTSLNGLRAEDAQYPPTLRSALGNFIAHAVVLMEQKGPLQELLSAATSLVEANAATTLIEDLTSHINTRSDERMLYERLSMGVAFVTLLGLAMGVTLSLRVPRGSALAEPRSRPEADMSATVNGQFRDLDATVAGPSAQAVVPAPAVDLSDQIRTEFLLQLVRATARRLGSHMELMKQVYDEVSKGVAASQACLVVGDTHTANSAIIETKATLGELGDLLDLNSVPMLIDATGRTIKIVERASSGFHDSMRPIIESQRSAFDLVESIEEALALVGGVSGVAITKSLMAVQDVNGSAEEMIAAMRCIIDNSLEAIGDKGDAGTITVQTGEELGAIAVTFTDNGQGMDAETRQVCTDAFFTTKEGHEGLGLSTAEYIIRKHGGRLTLNSVAGRGTIVRILLPADGEELPPE